MNSKVLLLPQMKLNHECRYEWSILYRNIRYDEVNQVDYDGKDIMFDFNIGKVPMKQIKTEDVQAFVDYVKQKIQ